LQGPDLAYAALVVIFSMLCTKQYSIHWIFTFTRLLSVKRLIPLWCRMLANTGSTVAIRWL
jgi:hypothetical protein